jgi:hypothetical protein
MSRLFTLAVAGTSGPCCSFRSCDQEICVVSWDREPKLTAWDLETGAIIDEALLPDKGGAGYNLVPHPEGEAMALVAYSGQSEEWLYWARFTGRQLQVFRQPEIMDVALPWFHPTGREFVSYHDTLGLARMRFPSGDLIASVTPEQSLADGSEDAFSYQLHFLRDDRFLVWQSNLALYEFDLITLRPTATVLTGADGIQFGEDRFFSESSWLLAGQRLLTSDCHYDRAFKHRTDTLRLWDASNLSGPLSSPDPLRPYTRELKSLTPANPMDRAGEVNEAN